MTTTEEGETEFERLREGLNGKGNKLKVDKDIR